MSNSFHAGHLSQSGSFVFIVLPFTSPFLSVGPSRNNRDTFLRVCVIPPLTSPYIKLPASRIPAAERSLWGYRIAPHQKCDALFILDYPQRFSGAFAAPVSALARVEGRCDGGESNAIRDKSGANKERSWENRCWLKLCQVSLRRWWADSFLWSVPPVIAYSTPSRLNPHICRSVGINPT